MSHEQITNAAGPPPAITADLVKKILLAIWDPGAVLKRGDDYSEPIPAWSARAVTHVLGEWLAGRTVVELPKPSNHWVGEAVAWQVGNYLVTADLTCRSVEIAWEEDPAAASWPADQARAIFLAGLAACDRVDQLLAGPSQGGGCRG